MTHPFLNAVLVIISMNSILKHIYRYLIYAMRFTSIATYSSSDSNDLHAVVEFMSTIIKIIPIGVIFVVIIYGLSDPVQ